MDELDLGATLRGFIPGQKMFSRYTLMKILGRGGMGVVWLARDEALEREVALKFLPDIVALDPEAMADLKRETRRNLDLTHPNIVRIYDFVSDTRTAAISMEYVNGPSLSTLKLERPGRVFTVTELIPWVEQLCSALSYAHTKAMIVHRDLKPANLMLTKEGTLKIADFGIARGISDSVSRVSAQLASTSGTPVYMSPQQMMGDKAAVTDDIYAVGATLYELLTGKPPFYSGNIVMQVQAKLPPRLNERRAEFGITGETVPSSWEETIAACLAKESSERPQSVEALQSQLADLATNVQLAPAVSAPAARAEIPAAVPADQRASSPPSAQTSRRPGLLLSLLVAGLVLVSFGAYLIITKFLSAERNGIVSTTDSSSLAKVVGPGQDTTSSLPMQRRAVSIQTVPAGGSIKVDSVGGGLSPLTLPGVTPGTYRVQADLPGHEPYLGEIQVEPAAAGQAGPLVVRLPMQRSTSQVRVTSDPVGLAYVMTGPNGAIRRGKTPALEDQLPTGIWEYTVSREGFDAQRGSINVKRGEVAQIQADLADGQLSIDSTPQGAEVWTAGARLGVTPLEISQVSPGPRDFELRLAGYERKVLATEVRAREATRELVVLQRRPYPTAGQKWENSLGMRFLPVPGMSVLVSVWETREQDYGAFVRATNRGGRAGQAESQAASHPVVEVSWDDARAFCEWLTEKERREGQLTARQRYRLPTDAEWSIAVGLDESGSGSPKEKDGRIKDVFPWGQVWPPPHGAGNYSPILAVDNFEGLAPVGSFAANQHGLHDLGGNVWEWCEDWYDPSTRQARVLRGASYSRFARDYLLSSYRSFDAPNVRDLYTGFRCVLDAGEVD